MLKLRYKNLLNGLTDKEHALKTLERRHRRNAEKAQIHANDRLGNRSDNNRTNSSRNNTIHRTISDVVE